MTFLKKRSDFIALNLCILSLFWSQADAGDLEARVDFSARGRPMENYWRGSGFTPGSQLLRKDMQLTLDYLSAVPNRGILYLRPHWLLNLVRVEDPYGENPAYDFDALHRALDEMVTRGLKPVFEIMGYPRIVGNEERGVRRQGALRWVPDFLQEEDTRQWHRFVIALVEGLEQRYGREEVLSWYFECTNEPDGSDHFWDQGIPALLNYWDATGEAIKTVDPAYVFGGPGNAHILSDTFKAVLNHAEHGTNAITGEQGSVLDFISVHHKALPREMIRMERRSLRFIQKNHPALAARPFWNNEADPTWGWADAMWWRPTPWYAAFLVRSVDAHNQLFLDREAVTYGLLINDHNFLGDWYQRTLLARVSHPQDRDRFWLVPKPVLHGMTLLSYLEGERFPVNGISPDEDDVSVLAVRRATGEIVVLIAHGPEFGDPRAQAEKGAEAGEAQRQMHDSTRRTLSLLLTETGLQHPVVSHIRMDAVNGNAYAAWQAHGSPEALNTAQYRDLITRGEPVILERRKALTGNRFSVDLPGSALSMLILSEPGNDPPPPAPEIKSVTPYTSFEGGRKDFVRWAQAGTCIQSFHVQVSHDGGAFETVTNAPVLALGFTYVWPGGVDEVRYRVVALPL